MIDLLLFTIGLAGVLAGAELLVRGASRLAQRLGIAPLVVGLTVVAFGTSAPELAITVRAAFTDHAADLALGNIVGSNIANILLVLGLAALIAPIVVAHRLIRIHVPMMLAASLLTVLLALDGALGTVDGAILLAGLAGYLALTLVRDRTPLSAAAETAPPAPLPRAVAGLLLGIPLLAGGAFLLVDAAAALAAALGISDLVIGLTLVAVGTSLPEIATTLAAYRLGDRQMAVGNLVGSNIFNLLAVLGVAALLAPEGVAVAGAALAFDLPVMLAVSFACLPVFFTGYTIARWEGGVFLGYYAAYCAFLFLAAAQHQALGPFSAVMLGFALPLTVITLGVGVTRQLRDRRRGLYS
ncbi:calcium/sodium antiporter [Halorhodospira halophila]|uniref:Na+/Ca+ antiporter, CaCA family n=1 Tax=Halorhodospira halophila (strain DSM 244 / SL1) TaxID=349124 RepID=A1WVG9_HALHL|nr:calcium/sodium antiporter [Halorhodospira halophila]ABM61681.1 Na+/Ca+ antiporter, CaCA family [Halorhodospira halophila SL1]MBK1728987.1 sodium:calcium antiporter [Halorhodospira halophila]